MISALLTVALVAIIASLLVPVMMLTLSRVGLFPPVTIEIAGKTVTLAPAEGQSLGSEPNVALKVIQTDPVIERGASQASSDVYFAPSQVTA